MRIDPLPPKASRTIPRTIPHCVRNEESWLFGRMKSQFIQPFRRERVHACGVPNVSPVSPVLAHSEVVNVALRALLKHEDELMIILCESEAHSLNDPFREVLPRMAARAVVMLIFLHHATDLLYEAQTVIIADELPDCALVESELTRRRVLDLPQAAPFYVILKTAETLHVAVS